MKFVLWFPFSWFRCRFRFHSSSFVTIRTYIILGNPAFFFPTSFSFIQLSCDCYFVCDSSHFFYVERALVGSNARNPRWVFNKFQNLQRNCGKGGALSAKSCIKSVGDEGFREKKDGSVGDGDGLIIVDHGSRRQESNLMLSEFHSLSCTLWHYQQNHCFRSIDGEERWTIEISVINVCLGLWEEW